VNVEGNGTRSTAHSTINSRLCLPDLRMQCAAPMIDSVPHPWAELVEYCCRCNEYQIAGSSTDDWAFEPWRDKSYLMQQFRQAEEGRNDLVAELKRSGAPSGILRAARNL